MLVFESDYFDQFSESDDGLDHVIDNAKDKAVRSLIKSKNKKDQQFVNLKRVQRAMRYGVKIGFRGFQ